jgi:L-ascorbate metabolism protein UlaG (beta-lactamase superfamily)
MGRMLGFRLAAAALATALPGGCANLSLSPADYNSTDLSDFYSRYRAPEGVPAPGALSVTFLGTTSLLFSHGETRILIDGFITRPPIDRVLGRMLRSDGEEIQRVLNRVSAGPLTAVIVAHSHYDHALDSAFVARQMRADLYGSPSTLNLGHGNGVPLDDLLPLRAGVETKIGTFHVTPLRGGHSPVSAYNDNLGEEITRPLRQPVHASRLVEGGSFDFLIRQGDRTMLVRPAAGYEAGALHGVQADVLFLAVGTLGNQRRSYRRAFFTETVCRVRPRLIVPVHWDSPFRRLTPNPPELRGTPYVLDDVRKGLASVVSRATAGGVAVIMPQAMQTIALDHYFTPAARRLDDCPAPVGEDVPRR